MIFFALIVVFGIALIIVVFHSFNKSENAPPGPTWAIPMIGHVLQVARAGDSPTIALVELAKTYGDVFSLKLGRLNYEVSIPLTECSVRMCFNRKDTLSSISKIDFPHCSRFLHSSVDALCLNQFETLNLVVLSSLESITDVFSKPEVLDRPLVGTLADRNLNMNIGVAISSGDFWNKKRTWVVKTLRDYGFGISSSMGASCVEEAQLLVDKFNQAIELNGESGVLEVRNIFLLPVFKILWRMMANGCTEEDEKILIPLLEKSQKWFDVTTFGPSPVMLLPALKYIAPKWTGHSAQMEFYKEARKVSNSLLHEMSFLKSDSPENFIHAYTLEMKKDKANFFEEDFYAVFVDLINGGSDTSNAFLEQIMLYMIFHPDVQEKVQREIDDVIPEEEEVSYSFAARMPFTLATMLETHRIGQIVPNLIPRMTSQNIEYKGFTIEKGTVVFANLRSAFNQSIFGKDPDNFRPERFIDETTGQLNSLRWNVLSFGVGKRICPGENLAQVTAFVFFVTILRNFKLSCIPNEPKPSAELHYGVTTMPQPYRMLVGRRK